MIENLQELLDLRKTDVDAEVFEVALAIRHISILISNGGSEFSRPDLESALYPEHLEVFLTRAVEMAKHNRRFEQEWHSLQQIVPPIKIAWEKGQLLFQEAVVRATSNVEEMECFSQLDFAVDCYAYVSSLKTYPDDRVLQMWRINGYMAAWRVHLFTDLDGEEPPGHSQ